MNRFEMIRQTLLWEQVAAAAKARAARLRDELTQDAQAEYAEQGTAPTWRLPDIGTVSLPVSQQTVYVADEQALLEWFHLVNPDAIECQYRVRPTYVAELLRVIDVEDGHPVVPGDERTEVAFFHQRGEIVPGLAVREGGRPGSLTFRPSPDAKRVAAAGAELLVESLEQSIAGPVVLAEAPRGPEA